MTVLFGVYKCMVCGNVVTLHHAGVGALTCCDAEMRYMKEGTTDASKEKHVPFIEKTENGYRIQVGSVKHDMTKEHWIEWIELVADGKSYYKFLKPGDEPVAEFCVKADKVTAREYCNLHGHWKAELN